MVLLKSKLEQLLYLTQLKIGIIALAQYQVFQGYVIYLFLTSKLKYISLYVFIHNSPTSRHAGGMKLGSLNPAYSYKAPTLKCNRNSSIRTFHKLKLGSKQPLTRSTYTPPPSTIFPLSIYFLDQLRFPSIYSLIYVNHAFVNRVFTKIKLK